MGRGWVRSGHAEETGIRRRFRGNAPVWAHDGAGVQRTQPMNRRRCSAAVVRFMKNPAAHWASDKQETRRFESACRFRNADNGQEFYRMVRQPGKAITDGSDC